MTEVAEGSVPAGDFEPVEEVVVDDPDVSVDDEQIAREVLAGHWGRGRVRDARLAEAGYDVKAVNKALFMILDRK